MVFILLHIWSYVTMFLIKLKNEGYGTIPMSKNLRKMLIFHKVT